MRPHRRNAGADTATSVDGFSPLGGGTHPYGCVLLSHRVIREVATDTYERIKATNALPSPAGVAVEVLRLTGDRDAPIEAITELIESDPALAGRLLKYANSPVAGLFRQLASVRTAVLLLGSLTVRSIVLSLSLMSERTSRCPGFEDETFWSESLARAVTCRNLYTDRRDFTPDEAFTCGLLSQIGRLAFATVYPEAYAVVAQNAGTGNIEALCAEERTAFGMDHRELSARMMADWRLPIPFCDAARAVGARPTERGIPGGDSRGAPLEAVLDFAAAVASLVVGREVLRQNLTHLVSKAASLEIHPDRIADKFRSIADDWTATSGAFSLKTREVPPLGELYARAV